MKPRIVTSKGGAANLLIETGGRAYPLYSRYDPVRDGRRIIGGGDVPPRGTHIFIGLGLGYQVLPLLEGGTEENAVPVVILEPAERLVDAVMSVPGVRRILRDTRVRLVTGEEVDGYVRSLSGRYEYLLFDSVRVVTLPVLKRLDPDTYRSLERRIEKQLGALATDGLTIARFARRWVLNARRNGRDTRGVRPLTALHRAGGGERALLTGAGPTLTDRLEDIRRHRRDLFLIAVDASVKPLLSAGIRPDLIVTIDAQPQVWYHFAGVEGSVRSVPVVLSFLSHPAVYGLFDRRYLFITGHPLFTAVDARAGERDRMTINHRAVSSVALEVALRMEFSPILLAGFDFSHPGMRCYAAGSFFQEYAVSRGCRLSPASQHETRRLRSRSDLLLGEYGEEMEALIRARGTGFGVFPWGDAVWPVREGAVPTRKTDRRPTGALRGVLDGTSVAGHPVMVPGPPPDVEWGIHLSGNEGVITTLALRARILRGAGSPDEARSRAIRFLSTLE